MLSPNATNRVWLRRGGDVTRTLNRQTEDRRLLSCAVHVTCVVPIGSLDPLGGVHSASTGAMPPETEGKNVTTADMPSSDWTCLVSGHVIVRVSGDGFAGLLHAATKSRRGAIPISRRNDIVSIESVQCIRRAVSEQRPAAPDVNRVAPHAMAPGFGHLAMPTTELA